MAKIYKYRPQTKHFNVCLHHFCDYVLEQKKITIHPSNTSDQPADVLTKALNEELLERHCRKVLGRWPPHARRARVGVWRNQVWAGKTDSSMTAAHPHGTRRSQMVPYTCTDSNVVPDQKGHRYKTLLWLLGDLWLDRISRCITITQSFTSKLHCTVNHSFHRIWFPSHLNACLN